MIFRNRRLKSHGSLLVLRIYSLTSFLPIAKPANPAPYYRRGKQCQYFLPLILHTPRHALSLHHNVKGGPNPVEHTFSAQSSKRFVSQEIFCRSLADQLRGLSI